MSHIFLGQRDSFRYNGACLLNRLSSVRTIFDNLWRGFLNPKFKRVLKIVGIIITGVIRPGHPLLVSF
jgi:hypothetical protein